MSRSWSAGRAGRAARGAAIAMAVLGACAAAGADAVAAPATAYVSTHAVAHAADTNCASAAFATIQAAVTASPAGATVVVCTGAYRGTVTVTTPLTLVGEGAVLQAAGSGPAVTVRSSGVTLRGLIVTGATGEGILVEGTVKAPLTRVTVVDNLVLGNDRGNPKGSALTSSPYTPCDAQNGAPGDCGEGIHLTGTADSLVSGNTLADNDGGILLSDEGGPVAHDQVVHNVVVDNNFASGISLVGRSGAALALNAPAPSAGGVFANTVADNTVNANGTGGDGSGILLLAQGTGDGVYANRVQDNLVALNSLAGIAVEGLAAAQDLSGNVVTGNTIDFNGQGAVLKFGSTSDPNPTGLLVASANKITLAVTRNSFVNNVCGVWATSTVTLTGMATDRFTGVAQDEATG